MDIVVLGMRGLGVETVKNLVLSCTPRSIVLVDETETQIQDLGCNLYLSDQNIGLKRSQARLERLQELNPNVKI